MTETAVLLPLFLLLVFGLLRIGQVGVALMIANYAASAIARQVVQGSGDDATYKAKFDNLKTAGMKDTVVKVEKGMGLLADVTVFACAVMDAPLLLGRLEKKAFPKEPVGPPRDECGDGPLWVGPFRYNRDGPYFLIVRGKATARMNYQR